MEKKTRLVEYYVDQGQKIFGPSTATIFYSQCGEDLEIYIDFFHKYQNKFKNNGTYIELGASDGVKFSNTKYFEEELGFKGILIEPLPSFHEILLKTRPNNYIYQCAISQDVEYLDFLVSKGHGGGWVSGLEKYMDDKHKQIWHKEHNKIKVKCRQIKDLIEENNIKKIELFSIDVEGAEYEVLKTFDWKIPVYVFCIEMSGKDVEKDNKCRSLLKDNKYYFHKKIGLSEIWYSKEYLGNLK